MGRRDALGGYVVLPARRVWSSEYGCHAGKKAGAYELDVDAQTRVWGY